MSVSGVPLYSPVLSIYYMFIMPCSSLDIPTPEGISCYSGVTVAHSSRKREVAGSSPSCGSLVFFWSTLTSFFHVTCKTSSFKVQITKFAMPSKHSNYSPPPKKILKNKKIVISSPFLFPCASPPPSFLTYTQSICDRTIMYTNIWSQTQQILLYSQMTVKHLAAYCFRNVQSNTKSVQLIDCLQVQIMDAFTLLRLYLSNINHHCKTHTHTSDANQCTAVVPCHWSNQCLPITPGSCDWPAQDEMDIIGCTPLHLHSAKSHTAVQRWWEGNRREE